MADFNETLSLNGTATEATGLVYTPTPAELVFVGLNIFIFFAGSTLNALTIGIIFRHGGRSMDIQNLLVTNFCASNLLLCVIAADTSRRMLTVPFHNAHLCRFRAFSLHVIMCASVYSLLLVSFHRYFVILYPRSRLGLTSVKKTLLVIGAVWMVCVFVNLPPLTGLWGKFGYEKETRACTLIRSVSGSFTRFTQIINFVAPLGIHMFCYGHIFLAVRRQNLKMEKHKQSTDQQSYRRRRQEWHLTLLTFCIIVTYVLCFLPYTISILTSLIRTPFHAFAVAILWMHIVINPLMYLLGDSRLRNTLRELLQCKGTSAVTGVRPRVDTADAGVQANVSAIPLVPSNSSIDTKNVATARPIV